MKGRCPLRLLRNPREGVTDPDRPGSQPVGAQMLFDMIQPVCSEDSPAVHLAPHDWAEGDEDGTLCALPVNDVRPAKTYHKHGCVTCAVRALAVGIYAVRESETSVVNLARFVDSQMPPSPG